MKGGSAAAVPINHAFSGVSVLLPTVTEVESLRSTVGDILATSAPDISELIFVVCDRTTDAALRVCEELRGTCGKQATIYQQRRPFLGNAIRESFSLAAGSHVVLMATDLETDPATLPDMITQAKRHPRAVVTASRWLRSHSFTGYGPIRVLLNYLFQAIGRVVYRTRLSDLTFGYRIFPTPLVQRVAWRGERHDFLLETILIPLRLGVSVIEVPTKWVPRIEGASQNSLALQAEYVRMMLANRLRARRSLLRSDRG